ncbi:kinetochore protein Spc24 [Syngnathoides biaculeatus]|uniref:kinetochore protein Spc24 n=1 Tax=Syngnathoides biaculeatus TaxID=300417 RepID=UPI002ADE8782|nr:kinetochore protein Spc24 [Syngnathoides biaculeatus]XP_061702159.1 kinetochore protein Spc24 [Syngnathoides biaculeatus]
MSGDQAEDFQETLDTLVGISRAQLDHLNLVEDKQKAFFDQMMETRQTVTHILKDLIQEEESMGQMLADKEEERKLRVKEMQSLDEELSQVTAKSHMMDAELEALQRELEQLRSSDNELAALENEIEDDTSEVIPSAIHVAKLYSLVTKIKWDYDTEPHILKGVHYGSDVASPIHINTSVTSRRDIADKLWNFVSSDW